MCERSKIIHSRFTASAFPLTSCVHAVVRILHHCNAVLESTPAVVLRLLVTEECRPAVSKFNQHSTPVHRYPRSSVACGLHSVACASVACGLRRPPAVGVRSYCRQVCLRSVVDGGAPCEAISHIVQLLRIPTLLCVQDHHVCLRPYAPSPARRICRVCTSHHHHAARVLSTSTSARSHIDPSSHHVRAVCSALVEYLCSLIGLAMQDHSCA